MSVLNGKEWKEREVRGVEKVEEKKEKEVTYLYNARNNRPITTDERTNLNVYRNTLPQPAYTIKINSHPQFIKNIYTYLHLVCLFNYV